MAARGGRLRLTALLMMATMSAMADIHPHTVHSSHGSASFPHSKPIHSSTYSGSLPHRSAHLRSYNSHPGHQSSGYSAHSRGYPSHPGHQSSGYFAHSRGHPSHPGHQSSGYSALSRSYNSHPGHQSSGYSAHSRGYNSHPGHRSSGYREPHGHPRGYRNPPHEQYHHGQSPHGHNPHHQPGYDDKCKIHNEYQEGYNLYGITFKDSYNDGYSDQYYVAFLGKACARTSIYDLLQYSVHNDTYDGHRPCGCLGLLTPGYTKYDNCYSHYKSSIMVDWEKMCIDKVRVSLYKNGYEVKYFVFNGHGTTAENFFSKKNLVYSPYSDLDYDADTNYFSVKGHVQRRFFINEEYGGHCDKDKGWLVVIDGDDSKDKCDWTYVKCYPTFLYSYDDGSTVWDDGDFAEADLFVISVKLKYEYLNYRDWTVLACQHGLTTMQ